MEQIRVVLADDHVIVRDGIKSLLEVEANIVVVGEASDGVEALEKTKELDPDLLIVDIRMPNLNGIETIKKLKELSLQTKTMVLSMHDLEEYILRSIESGADGYLLKDTSREEFVKAIHTIKKGNKYFSSAISNVLVNNYLNSKQSAEEKPKVVASELGLTRRENEILKMVTEGLSNRDIAERLEKSVRTIETHRFNIMKKPSKPSCVARLACSQRMHPCLQGTSRQGHHAPARRAARQYSQYLQGVWTCGYSTTSAL